MARKEAKDKFKLNDKVVFCYNNSNYIGAVIGFNENKVKVKNKNKEFEIDCALVYKQFN